MSTPKIFVSYRREDSDANTGRIYDRLIQKFSQETVFKDVDNMPMGVDFRKHLDQKLSGCRVLLAIIGREWATNPRLHEETDYVRIEIQQGMEPKRDILVVPVLVGNASMPSTDQLPPSLKDFAYRNAIPVRPDPDFHKDMDKLINNLEDLLDIPLDEQPAVVKDSPETDLGTMKIEEEEGLTRLQAALYHKDLAGIQRFLDAGDDVNEVLPGTRGETVYGPPLFVACCYFPDTVEMLIEHGADSNAICTGEEWTALHVCAESGNATAARIIVKHCLASHLSMRDRHGMTPADVARDCGHPELAAKFEEGTFDEPSRLDSDVELIIKTERWGEACQQDVYQVLLSAKTQIDSFFKKTPEFHISVSQNLDGDEPIALFEEGSASEYIIELTSTDMFWCQYAYQFSHEYCHVHTNYRESLSSVEKFEWFEEAICELCSIFTLRRMEEAWSTNPPHPNWVEYHSSLHEYAEDLISCGEDNKPDNLEFDEWFPVILPTLERNPNLRDENLIIATSLLEDFENNELLWEVVGFLNTWESLETDTFEDYLEKWKHSTPKNLRSGVSAIKSAFGV